MRRLLFAIAIAIAPAPTLAQTMDHSMHAMPGMAMPARPAAKPRPAPKRKATTPAKRPSPPRATPHAGHAMSPMPMPAPDPAADPHAGHDMSAMQPDPPAGPAMAAGAVGTDLPPGNRPAPAPAPARDHLADRFWGTEAMAAARENRLRREHGGMTVAMWLADLAEVRLRDGRDGYRWEG